MARIKTDVTTKLSSNANALNFPTNNIGRLDSRLMAKDAYIEFDQ